MPKQQFKPGQIVYSSTVVILVTDIGNPSSTCFAGVVIMVRKNGTIKDDVWPLGTNSNTWLTSEFKLIYFHLATHLRQLISSQNHNLIG